MFRDADGAQVLEDDVGDREDVSGDSGGDLFLKIGCLGLGGGESLATVFNDDFLLFGSFLLNGNNEALGLSCNVFVEVLDKIDRVSLEFFDFVLWSQTNGRGLQVGEDSVLYVVGDTSNEVFDSGGWFGVDFRG